MHGNAAEGAVAPSVLRFMAEENLCDDLTRFKQSDVTDSI
jgi:hypothetical protein